MTKQNLYGFLFRSLCLPTPIQGASMRQVLGRLAVLSVVGCLALSATTAQAVPVAQMLDDYDVEQYLFTPAGVGSFAGSTVVDGGSSIVGSSRSVYIEKTAGSSNSVLRVEALDDIADGASTFNVSRSAGIGGVALLQWDGQNTPEPPPANIGPQSFVPTQNLATNIMSIDMLAGNAAGIVIRVLSADVDGQTLTVDLFGNTAGDRMTQAVVIPSIVGATDILFPWAAFSTIGSPNLNAIRAFTLSLEGPLGSDITMDYIGTYVPEPASASMLGLGMVAIFARLRKRSRRQVTIADSQS